MYCLVCLFVVVLVDCMEDGVVFLEDFFGVFWLVVYQVVVVFQGVVDLFGNVEEDWV